MVKLGVKQSYSFEKNCKIISYAVVKLGYDRVKRMVRALKFYWNRTNREYADKLNEWFDRTTLYEFQVLAKEYEQEQAQGLLSYLK